MGNALIEGQPPIETATEVVDGGIEGWSAEEDPAAANQDEGEQRAKMGNTYTLQDLFKREKQTVQRTPDEIFEAGAMPETAKDHGDHQIGIHAHGSMAIASEGNIDVVADPAREGDVPATPEIRETVGEIRKGEVDWQCIAKQ